MRSITFEGAAGQVTGSCYHLQTRNAEALVDCGLFQGVGHSHESNFAEFGFKTETIKAVIITHAHLDHIGRLPKLFKEGYRGPVYATDATAKLGTLVLQDAFGIMEDKAERQNLPMLYEKEDLNRAVSSFEVVDYKTETKIADGLSFQYVDAGHILGSASAVVTADGEKIVFSGDLGHFPEPLLPKFDPPHQADVALIESTYGGVEHQDRPDRVSVLKEAVDYIVANRGVLIIPAFAIERSQELLFLFKALFHKNNYPKIPIYLDSPLAIEALDVFEEHCSAYDESARQACNLGEDIFSFRDLVLTPTVDESKSINGENPPKIIMAGSGMMEGGRIQHHLKHYISSNKTYLLIVGFQAEGTLGRKIVDGAKEIDIYGEKVSVGAKVVTVDNFSSHADNSDLLEWLDTIKGLKKVFVTHGEKERAAALKANINKRFPAIEVEVAQEDQTVSI